MYVFFVLGGGYTGSRKVKARFTDKITKMCNFIELAAEHVLSPDEWKPLLEAVTGVERVSYHPAGTIRRPLSGDHYQEYNFLVYSRFFPDTGMEFELSRNNHYKSKGWPYTVSALFKTQGDRAKQMEAWRILRASVQGKELLPDLVDHTDENLRSLTEACLLQKMEEAVTDDADQKRQALPGSASSAFIFTLIFTWILYRRRKRKGR